MTVLLDVLYGLALLIGWPLLLYRRWMRGPGSLALGERLGRVPARAVSSRCVWVHGVSLGEINAARTIVEELRRRSPETTVVVSATTQAGLQRARALYPKLLVFRFPVDFSFIIRRVLRRVRPSVIVLLELEVWPNLLNVAGARRIPVMVANGRVTHEKSVRRFNWPIVRWLLRPMFKRLAWVGAQDGTYAERFIALGTPRDRVEVTGSVKYDAADVADWIEGQEALAREMGIDRRRPLWVCGSTGPGEEAQVLSAYAELLGEHPQLQLAIVPRKPERFDEVAELVVSRGFACLRRSTGAPHAPRGITRPPGGEAGRAVKEDQAAGAGAPGEPRHVFLGDTLGELRRFYALATVVFVGRTLTPLGGSDVMEVAGLAKPLLVGPHTENFAEATGLLRAEGGCVDVASAADLAPRVGELLRDGARRERIGAAARRTILARRGATAKTVERILMFLDDAG